MNPNNKEIKDCDQSFHKETQTHKSLKRELDINESGAPEDDQHSRLPLPRDIVKFDSDSIKIIESCEIFQTPGSSSTITIVREITEETINDEPGNEDAPRKYKYCREVIRPFLKNAPSDCPDDEELLIKNRLDSAADEFPDFQPCVSEKDVGCLKEGLSKLKKDDIDSSTSEDKGKKEGSSKKPKTSNSNTDDSAKHHKELIKKDGRSREKHRNNAERPCRRNSSTTKSKDYIKRDDSFYKKHKDSSKSKHSSSNEHNEDTERSCSRDDSPNRHRDREEKSCSRNGSPKKDIHHKNKDEDSYSKNHKDDVERSCSRDGSPKKHRDDKMRPCSRDSSHTKYKDQIKREDSSSKKYKDDEDDIHAKRRHKDDEKRSCSRDSSYTKHKDHIRREDSSSKKYKDDEDGIHANRRHKDDAIRPCSRDSSHTKHNDHIKREDSFSKKRKYDEDEIHEKHKDHKSRPCEDRVKREDSSSEKHKGDTERSSTRDGSPKKHKHDEGKPCYCDSSDSKPKEDKKIGDKHVKRCKDDKNQQHEHDSSPKKHKKDTKTDHISSTKHEGETKIPCNLKSSVTRQKRKDDIITRKPESAVIIEKSSSEIKASDNLSSTSSIKDKKDSASQTELIVCDDIPAKLNEKVGQGEDKSAITVSKPIGDSKDTKMGSSEAELEKNDHGKDDSNPKDSSVKAPGRKRYDHCPIAEHRHKSPICICPDNEPKRENLLKDETERENERDIDIENKYEYEAERKKKHSSKGDYNPENSSIVGRRQCHKTTICTVITQVCPGYADSGEKDEEEEEEEEEISSENESNYDSPKSSSSSVVSADSGKKAEDKTGPGGKKCKKYKLPPSEREPCFPDANRSIFDSLKKGLCPGGSSSPSNPPCSPKRSASSHSKKPCPPKEPDPCPPEEPPPCPPKEPDPCPAKEGGFCGSVYNYISKVCSKKTDKKEPCPPEDTDINESPPEEPSPPPKESKPYPPKKPPKGPERPKEPCSPCPPCPPCPTLDPQPETPKKKPCKPKSSPIPVHPCTPKCKQSFYDKIRSNVCDLNDNSNESLTKSPACTRSKSAVEEQFDEIKKAHKRTLATLLYVAEDVMNKVAEKAQQVTGDPLAIKKAKCAAEGILTECDKFVRQKTKELCEIAKQTEIDNVANKVCETTKEVCKNTKETYKKTTEACKQKVTDLKCESKKWLGIDDEETKCKKKSKPRDCACPIPGTYSGVTCIKENKTQVYDENSDCSKGSEKLDSAVSTVTRDYSNMIFNFDDDESSQYDIPSPPKSDSPQDVNMTLSDLGTLLNEPQAIFNNTFSAIKNTMYSMFYDTKNQDPSVMSGLDISSHSFEEKISKEDSDDEDPD